MKGSEERVIDLDVIGERSLRSGGGPRYWWRRLGVSARVPVLVALGLFLLGGVIGGTVTHEWVLTQQDQAEASDISVLVLAETTGLMTAGVDGQRVRVDGQMAVVNAGPRSINVQDLTGDQQGLTLRAIEKQRWIQPAAWLRVDVTATLDCAIGIPAEPVALQIVVQTDDGRFSQVSIPVALQHTRWQESVDRSCVGVGGN
ncbi:hypothetical protein [Verrucosispora sp. WMMD573]|uniref:hypothetical protein n=1 Tax=Verrucosispora sp. WMMD573 TaxID=3015149 RepID=UPI00248C0175|nr:hypothetical protein [Verrucosispora sp. WMMD573]WBB52953.1 hypothetical protein O7601_20545 [Verrucosispora sp. WMMD573]